VAARVTPDREKRGVVLAERYAIGESREPLRLHFVTPRTPDLGAAGRVVLEGEGDPSSGGSPSPAVLLYDARRFTAAAEENPVDDARLRPVWGGRLHRIVLTARDGLAQGSHRVTVRAAGSRR